MLSPDDPHARFIVRDSVRRVASDTGFTTLVRIGEDGEAVFALSDHYVHGPDVDYQLILDVAVALEPDQRVPGPVSACALVLPDRHIAYVKHGTAPMTTLTIGPDPRDDPQTRREADDGLFALMQEHLARHTSPRPTGRAFPNLPNGQLPNGSPHHGPPGGWARPPTDPDARGPRR